MPTLQQRFYDYYASKPTPTWVSAWQTPSRTRALIATYFASLALSVISILLALLWAPAIFVYIAAMLVGIVVWTTLRSTIGLRDVAPREKLDDYEREVLDSWRVKTMTYSMIALLIGGIILTTGGIFLPSHTSPRVVATMAGLFMIFTYLILSSLPTVGFALTFNQPTED